MVCPLCGLRMHAEPDKIGQRIVCPDCQTEVVVPEPRREAKPELTKPLEYTISSEPLAPRPAPPKRQVEKPRKPVVPRVEKPDPRKQPFLANVFLFPWRGEVGLRWLMSSLGLVAASLIGAIAYSYIDAGMWPARRVV